MRTRNIIALGLFVVFYIAFGIYLTAHQEGIIYRPSSQDFHSCAAFATAEKVTYQGTRMYVELVDEAPTVMLYHGNAGSACDRHIYADIFSRAGLGYVIVEYAGYSNDTRVPSHKLLQQDVRHVIAYLDESEISPVYVVGESIGTGVASYHASLQSPEKVLLISPFTDLQAIAAERFWFYPTSLLVDNAFDNEATLQNYSGEIKIIHGTADDIIPYKLGDGLFQSLGGDKILVPIEGAGHNNLFTYEEMYQAIHGFLK